MSKEIWKEIPDYPSYSISDYGNIKNNTTNKIRKPSIKSGYCIVNLNGKALRIHRLVALTFIPNPEKKETVNHKDHNKINNNLDNLEWMTTKEQNIHKRKPTIEIQQKMSSRPVWRINNITNEKIELYDTICFASKWVFDNKLTSVKDFNGGNNIKTKISAVCQNRYGRKTAFGYKWEYENNINKYENEIWKDIPTELINNTKGKISNYGRFQNQKGRMSNGVKHLSGYLWAYINGKSYLLHRLVAKVFIPNSNNKKEVNHIDGNKENSFASNLEWCTGKENSQHAHDNNLINNSKKVIQYDMNMNKINEFSSIKNASAKLNLCHSSIVKCCNGKQKMCGNFIFKFV